MRKFIFKLAIVLFILSIYSSCHQRNQSETIYEIPDEGFITSDREARNDGESFITESENFHVTIFPVHLIIDDEGDKRVLYEFVLEPTYGRTFHNFFLHHKLNEKLDLYFAAGVVDIPMGPFDITYYGNAEIERNPGVFGTGFEVRSSPLIVTEALLEFAALEVEDIIDGVMQHGGEYSISLTWRGGEEIIIVSTTVIDKRRSN